MKRMFSVSLIVLLSLITNLYASTKEDAEYAMSLADKQYDEYASAYYVGTVGFAVVNVAADALRTQFAAKKSNMTKEQIDNVTLYFEQDDKLRNKSQACIENADNYETAGGMSWWEGNYYYAENDFDKSVIAFNDAEWQYNSGLLEMDTVDSYTTVRVANACADGALAKIENILKNIKYPE